jgi:hypothetical protein
MYGAGRAVMFLTEIFRDCVDADRVGGLSSSLTITPFSSLDAEARDFTVSHSFSYRWY